jgi:hypothetical protein
MIKGVEVTLDDGDASTSDIVDITECKELCDKADDELVKKYIKFLNVRGYEVQKKKSMPSESNGYNIGDFGLYD